MCEGKTSNKEVTILGTFYLKNGLVLEEKVILAKENTQDDVDKFIDTISDGIKTCFQKGANFQVTFGQTIFNGNELAAVRFKEM